VEYEDPWLRVVRVGGECVVDQPEGGGAVAWIECDGAVAVVEQYRVALDRYMPELPRGFAMPGEDPADCASREVREETGIRIPPGDLVPLGVVHPDSGVLSSSVSAFRGVVRTGPVPGWRCDEVADVRMIPVDALIERAARGGIADGITLSVLGLVLASGPVVAPR